MSDANSIMITPRSLSKGEHPALTPLKTAGYKLVYPSPGATPTEAELLNFIPNCVGWIAGVEPVSEAVIEAGQDLRAISRNGTGIDNLPLDTIQARNIQIHKTEGTNARGVAELALALILSGLRHIMPSHEGIRKGAWPRIEGKEICDCTIGIIGLGAIGSQLAKLVMAMGGKVLGYDPYADVHHLHSTQFKQVDLKQIYIGSDAISLHCPMPKDGVALIAEQEISLMQEAVILVNTARSKLIKETALLAALENKKIACYATDVFDVEPPEKTPLLQHPSVVLTSHIGGFTTSSVKRSTQGAVVNLLNGLGHNGY